MKAATSVILAAGRGSRMNSARPAVLHPLCGRSLAAWALALTEPFSESKPVMVVSDLPLFTERFGDDCCYALQPSPRGTADAVKCALNELSGITGPILIIYGNVPLLEEAYIEALIASAKQDGFAVLKCADESDTALRDAGAWCFMDWTLREAIASCDGTELDDLTAYLAGRGISGRDVVAQGMLCIPAVDRSSLWTCGYLMNAKLITGHFENGVTVMDPSSTYIEADVEIGRDTVIWPNVILSGKTKIGEDCAVFPGCQINDTAVGGGCTLRSVVSDGAEIGAGVKIGPFVNIRPGTKIADGCKIGDFVEIKNSSVGAGTKLPHLSYIGDADIGERVNAGCGTVFVNYNGFVKQRSTVGNDVFIGCQSALVAPLSIGDDAYIAAGAVITRDVPAGAMAFARARQENKEGYVAMYRALHRKDGNK